MKLYGRDRLYVGDSFEVKEVWGEVIYIPNDIIYIYGLIWIALFLLGFNKNVLDAVLIFALIEKWIRYDMKWYTLFLIPLVLLGNSFVLLYITPALVPKENWFGVVVYEIATLIIILVFHMQF